MSQEKVYVGVDIAKASFAVALLSSHQSYENSAAGHAAFISKLRGLEHGVQVICEASGGYEIALALALHQAGVALSVLNPRRVRDYAKATGQFAKTDRIDATILAEFGAKQQPPADPPATPEQRTLAGLVKGRQDVIELLNIQRNHEEHESLPLLRKHQAQRRKLLEQQLRSLDREIDACIAADPAMLAKAARLESVQGIGRVSALSLLALMPELGTLDPGQPAALLGVAPRPDDSGNRHGPRHIGGGRPALRRVLYMAAVSASQHNPILRQHYLQLRARGKPAKVALVAVMRKLIELLNRLIACPNFSLAS